eukprot:CAMPEP_0194477426 /NCGR_PEP_ID=MMETSP0253-20130528/1178_1 /TAXON_ID=2966 /ORGANISM="Noctiluca scintillans" /LENGTH=66 /DNA_ID=CAMNT_0039316401 /DNA_START=1 /DNA_END=197 /DNA_ORIENTATION=+
MQPRRMMKRGKDHTTKWALKEQFLRRRPTMDRNNMRSMLVDTDPMKRVGLLQERTLRQNGQGLLQP